MFVIRLLFILAALWIARKAWLIAKEAISNSNPPAGQPAKQNEESELMVVCKQCGTHLPESSAIKSNQEWFCCAEHRDAFNPDNDPTGNENNHSSNDENKQSHKSTDKE